MHGSLKNRTPSVPGSGHQGKLHTTKCTIITTNVLPRADRKHTIAQTWPGRATLCQNIATKCSSANLQLTSKVCKLTTPIKCPPATASPPQQCFQCRRARPTLVMPEDTRQDKSTEAQNNVHDTSLVKLQQMPREGEGAQRAVPYKHIHIQVNTAARK